MSLRTLRCHHYRFGPRRGHHGVAAREDRKAHSALGARRLPSARARNWDAEAVFTMAKYQAKETWYDSDGIELSSRAALFCGWQ